MSTEDWIFWLVIAMGLFPLLGMYDMGRLEKRSKAIDARLAARPVSAAQRRDDASYEGQVRDGYLEQRGLLDSDQPTESAHIRYMNSRREHGDPAADRWCSDCGEWT